MVLIVTIDFTSVMNLSFGFAEGGVVPQGFPNDSFPAMLTSGERIIPPNDTQRLTNFLDREESGQGNATTNALLADIANQLSKQQTITSEVKLNQRTFAQILLELNRTNSRVTA